MAKKNTIPRRISLELDDLIQEIKRKNEINTTQASKEIANMLKNIKLKKKEIIF